MTEIIDLIRGIYQEIEWIKAFLQNSHKTNLEKFKEEWLDGQDVMQTLHISKRTLQSLRDCSTLPHTRIKGKIYYKLSDIERLMQENYTLTKYSNNEDN